MNDDDRARPVSGEIMAGGPPQEQAGRRADFTDAEYETVEAAPRGASARLSEPEPAPDPAAGMDFLRSGALAADTGSGRGGPLFWIAGLALVALAFWVSGGHALVRQQVAALAPAEMRAPLRIADVKSRVERHNGRDVLFVDGRAENHGTAALRLPPIGITVNAVEGHATRYQLVTSGTELAPGGRYSFSSRLEAPSGGVKSVSVTFEEGVR